MGLFKKYDIVLQHNLIDYHKLDESGFIHLKKRNKLLLIGGFNKIKYTASDDINIFDLDSFKWNLLNTIGMPRKLSDHQCILSNDEKYLIVMNGHNGNFRFNNNNIYILNLDIMKWKTSTIKTPFTGQFTQSMLFSSSMSMNRMYLLIDGLLRKYSINNVNIPSDIISIINKMHLNTNIHLFNSTSHNHYYIDVKLVL